jgi:hypothetical protein
LRIAFRVTAESITANLSRIKTLFAQLKKGYRRRVPPRPFNPAGLPGGIRRKPWIGGWLTELGKTKERIPAQSRTNMNAIKAIVRNGRVEAEGPLDLPDGTELII